MERTKLGLSIPVMGALTYLTFLLGGYVAGLLVMGFIVLCETDTELKRTAVTALVFTVLFSLLSTAVRILPDMIDLCESFLSMFSVYLRKEFLNQFFNFVYLSVNILKTVGMLLLALFTLLGKPIKLGIIANMID